jgi:flagella basal body P-ring formation protein FlgA
MKVRSFYTFLLLSTLILPGLPAYAQPLDQQHEPIGQLQQAVYHFIEDKMPAVTQGRSIESTKIDVRRIDPRLRLSKCDGPLTHQLMQNRNIGGNLTVKSSCLGSTPWSIYTSAKVQMISPILVANRQLGRGDMLSSADVRFEPRDTNSISYGFITDMEQALGMELKRPIREGEALRKSLLVEPMAVLKGDSVVIEAVTGAISVVAPGEALSNGRTGQQIKVRNTKSDRVVRAKVVSPGKVQVIL